MHGGPTQPGVPEQPTPPAMTPAHQLAVPYTATALLEEKDRLVAGVLAFRGDASIKEALKSLTGSGGGMSVSQWEDHYLTRADIINTLKPRVSPIHAAAPKTHSHQSPSPEPMVSSLTGRSRHLYARGSRQKRARSQSVSDSDEYRPPRKMKKYPVTSEHKQLMAEWRVSCGAKWHTMSGRERWEEFSKEHGIRNALSWSTSYTRHKNEIKKRVAALREKGKGKAVEIVEIQSD